MKNISFTNNYGRIFFGSHIDLTEDEVKILDHQCIAKLYEGCVKYVEKDSLIASTNVSITNIISDYVKDLFVSTSSQIILNNVLLKNIKTVSPYILFYGKKSSLMLMNSFLEGFNKTLIYMEAQSNLLISNCKFYKLIAVQKISNFFACESCKQILLKNNSFEQCSTQSETCILFSLGY